MNTATAPKGRERTCNQCGAIYRSTRSTSRYCSTSCRKKANRGTAPTGGPLAGPTSWGIIAKALHTLGYVGQIGPSSRSDPSPPIYGLLAESTAAFNELAEVYRRKGWGIISRCEFDRALRDDGIRPFETRSPKAAENKQSQDRQRQRFHRAA